MNKYPNVYFVGKAGAGKSFSAEYLKKTYGYKTAKMAYPIYAIATNYFDMKEKDRRLLQNIGTEAGRDYLGKDLWINRLVEDIKIVAKTEEILKLPSTSYVSDDVRFTNEHLALSQNGWIGFYLSASDTVRKNRLVGRDGTAQEGTLNHISEREIDEFKNNLIQINAECSLEEMYAQISYYLVK